MNTWVLIALIVCGTGLVGFLIYALIASRIARTVTKSFGDFDKHFKF